MFVAGDLNLKYTVESGQPLTFYSDFHSGRVEDKLSYPTSKGQINVKFNKRTKNMALSYDGNYTSLSAKNEVRKRLGLRPDLPKIYDLINTDQFMAKAIAEFYGMRITENEPWEATLCFVISQFNNLKRIRHIISNLRNRFGEGYEGPRKFPTPQSIATASLSDIRSCGTGFRDKYLKSVAEEFSSGFDPKQLYRMKYDDAKEELMRLDGIGDKVADCILLFGYNKLEAFPIDVWIKRVVEKAYFNGKKKSIRQIHDFSIERWGKYRGYAQQYLFWDGRERML